MDEAIPLMSLPENDGAAPWLPIEHGLCAAPWQMMTIGRSWPPLSEDGKDWLLMTDENERE
jgi:hypothetical protein